MKLKLTVTTSNSIVEKKNYAEKIKYEKYKNKFNKNILL